MVRQSNVSFDAEEGDMLVILAPIAISRVSFSAQLNSHCVIVAAFGSPWHRP